MKTLFINIYKDLVSSYPNTEIIDSGKDNILDGFYISLGMAIAEGVSVGEYKSLVVDFAVAKPSEFKLFQKQWDELKLVLLSDNPQGVYDFLLSSEYLEWLKINASTVYYKKYQGQHQASIRLDIGELYEDTVDAIRRKVLRFLQESDNYKNFDEFVINDNIVNRRSKLVRAIKDKYEDNIAFVLYEKWKEDTKENVCPNCGKNPCECKGGNLDPLLEQIFQYYGIYLGDSSVNDLDATEKKKCIYKESGEIEYSPDDSITFLQSPEYAKFCFLALDPSKWRGLTKKWEGRRDKSILALEVMGYRSFQIAGDYVIYISPSNDYFIFLFFERISDLKGILINAPLCPRCKSHIYRIWGDNTNPHVECSNCKCNMDL